MSEKELTGIAKLLAEAVDRAEEREMQPLKKHWNQLRSQAATENSEGEQEPTASEREPH